MTNLAEFLLARYGEREAEDGGLGFWCGEWRCQPSDAERDYARAQVLAHLAAKREVVALHTPKNPQGTCPTCALGGQWSGHVAEEFPCPTLRALGREFVDHPDYNEAWRVTG